MAKIDLKGVVSNIGDILKRNAPEILTGVGISGMITATITAVRATPEAVKRLEAAKRETGHKKLTLIETLKATWKLYIPTGICTVLGTSCLIGAASVNHKRNAALATACTLAESTLSDYRAKVIETVGKKKNEAIMDAVNDEKFDRNPPPADTSRLITTTGAVAPQLCLDGLFGRYFYSDMATLKAAQNKLNYQMNNGCEPYMSLNEFYMEIGLPPVDIGDELGWRNDRGLIDLHFTSRLLPDGNVCLEFSHNNPPEYGYSRS